MARKLDRKRDFDISDRKRVFELLSLLEIAIGLAFGDAAALGKAFGGLGQRSRSVQQGASQIEPLGLLSIRGAGHTTYKYVYSRHKSRAFSCSLTLQPIANCSVKLEVIFCVQAVISPLLSDLVLDELDRELERRGHRFVRYADDANIYVRSEQAGQRVMESISRFITQKLKLRVNETKSAVARPQERKFLGFSFSAGPEVKRVIAPKALDRFKHRIREITRQPKSVSMKPTIEELAPYMRGWRNYFGFCETPAVLPSLAGWVRRLRAALWLQWKTRRRRRAALIALGVGPRAAANTADSRHGPWYLARSRAPSVGLSKAHFRSLGLPSLIEERQRHRPNRLVRTRMHGGVRGKAGDRRPIPIDVAGAGNEGSGASPTYRASSRPYQVTPPRVFQQPAKTPACGSDCQVSF
jgi:hypothetical protein